MFEPNQHTLDKASIPTVDAIKERVAPIDRSKRKEEVDKLYEQFINIMKQPVVLSYQEFSEFLPLFSENNVKELENTTNLNAIYNFHLLANKFINRINPYKEYYVQMEDGSYIKFPPVFNVILPMAENERHYVDICTNMATNASDQPWKVRKALIDVAQALARSQNIDIIRNQMSKFKSIADELKKKYAQENATEEPVDDKKLSVRSVSADILGSLEEEPVDM